MPKIADIKEIDGQVWVRIETGPDTAPSCLTIWSNDEINQYKRDCVRDFLIDLFDRWKDHQ